MSSMTLYDAAEELRTLFDTAEGIEDPAELAAFEKEMEPAFARALAKVEAFAGFLRHLDSQIDLCDAEIKRIKAHKDRFEKTRERLEDYAIRSMQANGVKSLEAPTAKLRLQPNPPSVVIEHAEQIPNRFERVTVQFPLTVWNCLVSYVSNRAHVRTDDPKIAGLAQFLESVSTTVDRPLTPIKEALKAGEEVPGARLERGVRLVVK